MSKQADRIIIFDTTLRDGEQCPGATLNIDEKLIIAKQLARLGVDIIEAGFAFASPGDFEAVNLDIQKVEVKFDDDSRHSSDDRFGDSDDDKDDHTKKKDDYGEWVDLAYTPAVVDVLKLRNGVEKMLADGNVKGTVRKVRITLGTNNTVVKGGVSYPINIIN